jgi:diguanylate cyclase (GGDEF)-like protein
MSSSANNKGAPLLPDERERLQALRELRILDTEAESAYDDITLLASYVCGTPISVMSLVDENRQWFKSKVGLDASETPRDQAFCAYAILNPDETLVVPDASTDERFRQNPLVTGDPNIRFYAGVPLKTQSGHALGTLCVIDRVPRQLGDAEVLALRALGRQVIRQLELRRALAQLDNYRSELEALNRDLERRSLTDSLTDLWNRTAFERRLGEEIAHVRRSGEPIGLLFIDADAFKAYNDTHGHPAGDDALVRISSLIRANKRENDFECRYGGEEFAVLLPNTDKEGCLMTAERIRKAIDSAKWPLRKVTVSIGVASLDGKTVDGENLVSVADACLYKAKHRGRNCVIAESL